jgi:hypothetical protein
LPVARAITAERIHGDLRFPTLEDVDPARVEKISGDREVQAARSPPSLLYDVLAARQVIVALFGIDDEVPCARSPLIAPSHSTRLRI